MYTSNGPLFIDEHIKAWLRVTTDSRSLCRARQTCRPPAGQIRLKNKSGGTSRQHLKADLPEGADIALVWPARKILKKNGIPPGLPLFVYIGEKVQNHVAFSKNPWILNLVTLDLVQESVLQSMNPGWASLVKSRGGSPDEDE